MRHMATDLESALDVIFTRLLVEMEVYRQNDDTLAGLDARYAD